MLDNAAIATTLEEIADYLAFKDANPFRIRAYRNAAEVIRDLKRTISEMIEQGEDLTKIPNVGADLSTQIKEMINSGRNKVLEELRSETPVHVSELLAVPGLGLKRIKTLHEKLQINTVGDLENAARKGILRTLSGFGEGTERRILEALAARQKA
jgi:DNA polymerase (family 10)